MKQALFIYNPNSGQQEIIDYIHWIVNFFSSKGYLTSIYATQRAGEARKIVEKIGKSFSYILVSGGDGTLDEVISGSIKAGLSPTFGYIPTGSTNDFAKSLNIPNDIAWASRIALRGREDLLDIGKFDEKYFVYVAAFGTISDVSYNTDQDLKNIFGRSAYVFEGLRQALPLSNLESYKTRISLDDEKLDLDLVHFMVTNSYSVGGFTGLFNENIGLDDGLFELTMIKKPNNISDINKIIQALTNRTENDMVIFRQSHKFLVETDRPVGWSLDGDFGGKKDKANIEILKQRIRIKNNIKD